MFIVCYFEGILKNLYYLKTYWLINIFLTAFWFALLITIV